MLLTQPHGTRGPVVAVLRCGRSPRLGLGPRCGRTPRLGLGTRCGRTPRLGLGPQCGRTGVGRSGRTPPPQAECRNGKSGAPSGWIPHLRGRGELRRREHSSGGPVRHSPGRAPHRAGEKAAARPLSGPARRGLQVSSPASGPLRGGAGAPAPQGPASLGLLTQACL